MDRYYLGSNTYKGFYSLYEEAIAPLDRVFLLKGGPGTGKSSLMKKVMKEGLNRGYSVECWHCSGDPNSLDGVLLKELGLAVIDATAPHAVEPKIPVAKEVIINLLDCVRRDKIKEHTHLVISPIFPYNFQCILTCNEVNFIHIHIVSQKPIYLREITKTAL